MRIVLLGPPGSGKGLQARLLSLKFSIPHIAVGDIFRKMDLEGSEVAAQAKAIMDEGLLIPDKLVLEIINERLACSDCANGYIFDGFPRTLAQATALENILQNSGQKLQKVFYLEAPENIIIERLIGRMTCPACGCTFHMKLKKPKKGNTCDYCNHELIQRGDDTEELIHKRLSIYNEQTAPLIDYYTKNELLKKIDVTQSIAQVTNDIVKELL